MFRSFGKQPVFYLSYFKDYKIIYSAQDGTGKLDFKEFVEYAWERKRNVRISQLVHAFEELDADDDGQVRILLKLQSYLDFTNQLGNHGNNPH